MSYSFGLIQHLGWGAEQDEEKYKGFLWLEKSVKKENRLVGNIEKLVSKHQIWFPYLQPSPIVKLRINILFSLSY